MKSSKLTTAGACLALLLAGSTLHWTAQAAEEKDNAIKQAMKLYHKAPKGTDPVCKKAVDGHASAEDLKNLVACYKAMKAAKPTRGDQASWTEKTTKLLAAAEALQKGEPNAAALYKEAVNCKACHSVHKPE